MAKSILRTNLPPRVLMSFQMLMDHVCLFNAIIRMSLILIIFVVPPLVTADYFLLLPVLLILAGWFTADYFSQPQKILFLEDRLVLVTLFSRINLFYENIRSVQPVLPGHLKLLKRKLPAFQIWGRRGWFSTKSLADVFLYSLAFQSAGQVLIRYAADSYIISVRDTERFSESLEMLIKK